MQQILDIILKIYFFLCSNDATSLDSNFTYVEISRMQQILTNKQEFNLLLL